MTDIDCVICLDKKDNEMETLPCNHSFHKVCIDRWRHNNTCPICREVINNDIYCIYRHYRFPRGHQRFYIILLSTLTEILLYNLFVYIFYRE